MHIGAAQGCPEVQKSEINPYYIQILVFWHDISELGEHTVITCNLEQGYKLEQTAISFELYHQMLSNLAHTMLH